MYFVNGEEIFELFCKVGRSFKPTNPVQLQLISQTSLILMIIIVVNIISIIMYRVSEIK